MSDPMRSYTCERCGGIFDEEWTDEEALAESTAMFGPLPKADLAVVCDDCWRAMGFGEPA